MKKSKRERFGFEKKIWVAELDLLLILVDSYSYGIVYLCFTRDLRHQAEGESVVRFLKRSEGIHGFIVVHFLGFSAFTTRARSDEQQSCRGFGARVAVEG